MSRIKLFCLPYAGGSCVMYNRWRPLLNAHIELVPIEVAGRGKRFSDPLCHSMDEMTHDLLRQMRGALEEGAPFALFGHSMGAVLAYELARRIREERGVEPVHLFFSGRYPPHYQDVRNYHKLPDEQFLRAVAHLGGLQEELLENPKALWLFLNVLRADFAAVETYQYRETAPFACDISVLYGEEDVDMAVCEPSEWARYSSGTCRWHGYPGGHFFVQELTERMVGLVNARLVGRNVMM